ncbi:MAG: DUF2723 domain-containing protein [Crocinitomicaceae bacterium]|nr:DUF2723 domain-containing protein [Crocinitomicaceae bacterium]
MNYKKLNLYLGWLVFLISTVVFFITIEDTVSLWDCGEYITAAYKLEVGHPPGAPLFMVIGRLFSFFAEPENVAVWINRVSALSSSATILFMFWSISMLVKKISLRDKPELTSGDKIAILGSAFIGSMAYTFSESFWFSAVEGEVYAMSSLFTAIIFWAILKWDEEMTAIQGGKLFTGYSPDRWLLLIMFMLGLAIGVHLLGILVVPAIAYVIYFRYQKTADLKGILFTGVLGVVILGFIQVGVIQGVISMASSFEVGFVNSLGLPFYSGTIFFFLLIVSLCVFLIRFARKKGNRILYSATMGLILLLIGYGSFAVIVIRSNANTPLDENDPENLVTLTAYLKREQYGSAPILFGQHWNSIENDREQWNDLSAFYLRRFVVTKGDKELKAFKDETRANEFAKVNKGEVIEKYFESNASTRKDATPTYAQTTFFPRMYWSQEKQRVDGYKRWSGYDANDDKGGEIGKDGNRLPTFGENMTFFARYQVNWMYWRYFMWNFSGRQNDIQGHGDEIRGNWISGFSAVDNARLGNQDELAPFFTEENPSNNRFFFLPIILGFIGLIFHFYRAPKDAFVLSLVFLFTGLAIIVYLNPRPFEPRERDYAYAGSFYFFAMWIGIGVYALYDAFKSFNKKELVSGGVIAGAGVLLTLIADMGSYSSLPITLSWIIMIAIGGGVLILMGLLRKALKKDVQGAGIAVALCLSVPLIMGVQGWDDHDRSLKTTAHNLSLNYLNSVEHNGIIFTNGDNDTFPLWYMQEVEGQRTDVRVCNLSLMQTDWYTDQMKLRAYESDPLPIKFTEDQILMYAGNTDQVLFTDLFELFYMNTNPDIIRRVIKMRADASPNELVQATNVFNNQASGLLASTTASDPRVAGRLAQIKAILAAPLTSQDPTDVIFKKYQAAMEVFSAAQSGLVQSNEQTLQAFQKLMIDYEKGWNYTDLAEAMEFTRDDENLINYNGQRLVRIFPSTGFVLPVNVKNAVASGVVSKEQEANCLKEMRFNFDKRGLTREQVMMLDIISNNEWKRGISFSSPGGSDVSIAFYRRGYVKQNGMAFELNPIDNEGSRFNGDKMYTNLMETYDYGAMDNPDVLTDYYARRHTKQYRLHFLSLAEEFVSRAMSAEQNNERRAMVLGMGQDATRLPAEVSKEVIKGYNTKAIALIKKSLEVMPARLVIDYGEPNGSSNPRDNYTINGKTLTAYTDGVLHDYIAVLYMAGDKAGAEKLGVEVADQLESIIGYYEASQVEVAAKADNTKDFYAALAAYFKISAAANEFGDPEGALSKRTNSKIDHFYKTMFPSMFDKLEALANANGETTRRGSRAGYYANMLHNLQDYSEAMAVHYGWMEAGTPEPQSTPAPVNGGSLDALMNPGQ